MKVLGCLALFGITACAHSPHCVADTGRPAYPSRFGVARLIPDTTLGFLRVTVREEGEGPLSGPSTPTCSGLAVHARISTETPSTCGFQSVRCAFPFAQATIDPSIQRSSFIRNEALECGSLYRL